MSLSYQPQVAGTASEFSWGSKKMSNQQRWRRIWAPPRNIFLKFSCKIIQLRATKRLKAKNSWHFGQILGQLALDKRVGFLESPFAV